jgi:hypothetical protein
MAEDVVKHINGVAADINEALKGCIARWWAYPLPSNNHSWLGQPYSGIYQYLK